MDVKNLFFSNGGKPRPAIEAVRDVQRKKSLDDPGDTNVETIDGLEELLVLFGVLLIHK